MTFPSSFVVSAPGKVIIFGEHAAVFGKPAIAAAISLRTYLLVQPNDNRDEFVLDFPDIGFEKRWRRDELPWDLAEKYQNPNHPPAELIPELVSELSQLLSVIDKPIHYSAAYSFLYLYTSLCNRNTEGYRFTIRSALPIGAGLGSSATISVCLAAAFSLIGNHTKTPTLTKDDLSTDSEDSLFIDSWAFLGEKCIHGNPSGIDNACATHGGAVMFQRMQSSIPSVRTTMRNFPQLRLLLTNTTHPRRTADLVANVTRLVSEYPKVASSILDAIENLTREAYNIVIRPFIDEAARDRLRELFEINHGLLVALGVSHPTLEKARILTDEMNIGKTKLTGAGGGGCAITLLNEHVDQSVLEGLSKKYKDYGFDSYQTSLGGKGVGFIDTNDEFSITPDAFLSLGDRAAVEEALGGNLEGWKFW